MSQLAQKARAQRFNLGQLDMSANGAIAALRATGWDGGIKSTQGIEDSGILWAARARLMRIRKTPGLERRTSHELLDATNHTQPRVPDGLFGHDPIGDQEFGHAKPCPPHEEAEREVRG